jgi:N-acetylmuramoyl-L-alanine amidase
MYLWISAWTTLKRVSKQSVTQKHFAPYLLFSLLCTLALFPIVNSAAMVGTSVSFVSMVGEETRSFTLNAVDVQGISYVSLPSLTLRLGGETRVLPTKIQVDLAGSTAVIGINDTQVNATRSRFYIIHPIIRQNMDVLVSVHDTGTFFSKAFYVTVRETAATVEETSTDLVNTVRTDLHTQDEGSGTLMTERDLADDEGPPGTLPIPSADEGMGDTGTSDPYDSYWPPSSTRSMDQVIIIDAGHGGHDTGYTGPGGLVEKELTLSIAQHVRRLFKETTSFKSYLTRAGDQDMTVQHRVNIANREAGDLFVSIHGGASFTNRAHGFEIFTTRPHATTGEQGLSADVQFQTNDSQNLQNSMNIAETLAQAVAVASLSELRAVREMPIRILRDVSMPGFLIEVGFLSNSAEETLLSTDGYREKIALGIVKGIEQALRRHGSPGALQ